MGAMMSAFAWRAICMAKNESGNIVILNNMIKINITKINMTMKKIMKINMTTNHSKRIGWLVMMLLAVAILLIQMQVFEATADSKSYTVSLNSPVTFPVDI